MKKAFKEYWENHLWFRILGTALFLLGVLSITSVILILVIVYFETLLGLFATLVVFISLGYGCKGAYHWLDRKVRNG